MVNYKLVLLLVVLLLIGEYYSDIEQAWMFCAEKISPNNPELGLLIFSAFVAVLIFFDNIVGFFYKKKKYKLKQKF